MRRVFAYQLCPPELLPKLQSTDSFHQLQEPNRRSSPAPDEMCFPHMTPESATTMGFDSILLKRVLEQFVDDIAEESVDLIAERPRFAHAVVVLANDDGDLCQASCVRQLDVVVHETTSAYVESEWLDEEIQRALRSLNESCDLLSAPRAVVVVDLVDGSPTNISIKQNTPTRSYEFPSMNRGGNTRTRRQ